MARIHKSKDHLGADVRRIRLKYALGWLGRIAAALLLVACYVLLWKHLRAWGDKLAAMYHGWAVEPLMLAEEAARAEAASAPASAFDPVASPWQDGLKAAWVLVVRSAEMAVRLLPLLLPAFVAGVVLWVCSRLMAPMQDGSFQGLRAGVEGERYALSLARKMSRSCHVFVNKYIPYDGHWSETDLILVGPGGVAIVEVKNWSGQVQGDASDEQIARGGGRTQHNPVRQVGTHVYRLKNYLRSKGVNVWVVPCVVFVHPRVKLNITGVPDLYQPDERGTVVITARQFRDRLARPMENGNSLTPEQIQQVVRAIKAAPARKAGE